MSLSATCADAWLAVFADAGRCRNGNTISSDAKTAADRILEAVTFFIGVSMKKLGFIPQHLERGCPNFLQAIFLPRLPGFAAVRCGEPAPVAGNYSCGLCVASSDADPIRKFSVGPCEYGWRRDDLPI